MLHIQIPFTYQIERDYIISLCMKDFLGIEIDIHCEKTQHTKIYFNDNKQIIIPDDLFSHPIDQWLKVETLPRRPLYLWDSREIGIELNVISPFIPVIYGNPKIKPIINHFQIVLPIDIFGSAFFMLTRYEEYVIKIERDKHDRFPASSSYAFQNNFLDRPIINEYLEILWSCLKYHWPQLQRKKREYRFFLSHDVDNPICVSGKPFVHAIKRLCGDIIIRKNASLTKRTLRSWISKSEDIDPCNTFDFILTVCSKNALQTSFYFITDFCETYNINSQWIKNLIRKLHERGHEVGLHASYYSYKNFDQLKREFIILLSILKEQKINQLKWGGRQHYLRWGNPVSWQHWEDVGINYDSTLGFAEYSGFRCGICYEYQVFNLLTQKKLNLIERPLIVMEGSLFHYMKKPINKAKELIIRLNRRCRQFNGYFTLLWHNDQLIVPKYQQLFSDIVSFCK